jgi:hypothetical protein
MIHRFAWLLLLVFAACRPDGYSYESNTSGEDQESLNSSASLDPGESMLSEAPLVLAPYEASMQMRSEVKVFDHGVLSQSLMEVQTADGAGQFALELIATKTSGSSNWIPASVAQRFLHEQRQHFLVRFRGPAIHDSTLAQRNYSWRELDGNFTVADIPVRRYRLKSLYGIGDVIFDVDPSTHVMLAWTIRDPAGTPVLRQTATEVDYSPDFQGISWADVNVATEAYDGLGAQGSLGFDPLKLTSSGAGFENSEQKTLSADQLFAGQSKIHLNLLNDGVRTVAIAQQDEDGVLKSFGTEVQAITLHHSEDTGVTVVEGPVLDKFAYAIGPVPLDDLLLFLASLTVA